MGSFYSNFCFKSIFLPVFQFLRYCAMQEERKKQGRPYPPTPYQDGVSIIWGPDNVLNAE